MEEALRSFQDYEVWFYLVLGLVGLYYVRKFILSWQELREAVFGLERESAQRRLNSATIMLVLVLSLVVTEFILVSFVAPGIPGTSPLNTPTLDLLASPTITLASELESTAVVPEQVGETTIEPIVATGTASPSGGCVRDQVFIDSPRAGSEIQDIVEILGTVDIPNFGFYKIEMKRPEEQSWLTILAGNEVKRSAVLGAWNTSLLAPGEYQLALVAVDNQGQELPACIVQVRITNVEATE